MKSERALKEEKILQFWKENKIFEKTLEKSGKEFVFYEGPPTANGKPGIHHLEARAFKDAIPRYKTMRGYHVPRKGGWDTHGLPVELEVEKQLGIKGKSEIESKIGVKAFNEQCKKSVWKYVDEWQQFTDRTGYWVDLENAYVTYHNSYIESVWSILSHVENRGLLYKDYKVLPWCSRCGTALSSHELAQGYQDVKDISLYVKFKVKNQENTYLVAWTTTPWTLPGNVALAVGENIKYAKYNWSGENIILAKDRASKWPGHIQEEFFGRDLVGLEYEPLYEFSPKNENSHRVYAADFVNTEDGTGIVHTAVMYGQDDFELGTKIGLPKNHLVDDTGHFKENTGWLAGKSVVEEETAVEILKDLQNRSLLFDKESHIHSYPFCWRCKTRLIYYARDSWYIAMSKLRDELVDENQKINWEPGHIKDGRFGEWLKEIKDWAISRERYWGTPLPIWQSADGVKRIVVDSLDTLKKYTKKSGNKYFVMRHGEADHNVKNVLDLEGDPNVHLTERGKEQVIQAGLEDVDLVFCAPFPRGTETAGLIKKDFVSDERLREMRPGENDSDMKRRLLDFMFEIENKYQNKKIVIVSHQGPLNALIGSRLGLAQVSDFEFVPYPHNDDFELDLHRPYIDEIVLEKDGEEYRRVKEVVDVWFDSGSMPFAQDPKNLKFPADYISEAIDQTRGWFYTLHAIGVLMGKGNAYKNVICLGHILDKDGKKMSKSVGNVVNPWEMIDKYGVDVLRLWMYSVNQPGESKNFDERTVDEINKRVFNLLDNVYSFYELYRDKNLESAERPDPKNVLDRWILVVLDALVDGMTAKLDDYKLMEPVRMLREFTDELSTWYLRRSRDRIKDGDADVKKTLYFVLKRMAVLLAPFAPFAAEDLYKKLHLPNEPESVHLHDWPEVRKSLFEFFKSGDQELTATMLMVRNFVTMGLNLRSKKDIKVRQPLKTFTIKHDGNAPKYWNEVSELLRDELNVKEVVLKSGLGSDAPPFDFDWNITSELKSEGELREEVRSIQDMRKQKGLKPGEKMKLKIPEEKRDLYEKYKTAIELGTNVELE